MTRPSFSRLGLPILAGLGLVFAVWVALSGRPDRSMTEPPISPPRVPDGLIAGGTVAGTGLVEPSSELVELSPQVAGVVSRVLVTAGDRVAAGQLLLQIDSRDAQARLGEAQAALGYSGKAVASARIDAANARRQLDLLLGVSDPAAVSEQQRLDRRQALAAAEAGLALAEADRARARAQLDSARTELERREIRSPRAGEILQVRTRPGQYVTAGPGPGESEPPITMGETRPLHVRVDVDETEIGRVRQGAEARVSTRGPGARQVTAQFVRLEPLVIPKRSLTNQSNERVDVRVLQLIYALPADVQGFAVGQQVDAFLPAADASAGGAAK
jgi:HlyD family secretion protein